MIRIAFILSLAALSGCQTFTASSESADDSFTASNADVQMRRLKKLEGTWIGTAANGEEKNPVESRWRVTAAGTAIEETLFFGSTHEMVSLIHRDGPQLMLTHYCSAGNQPRLRAEQNPARVLETGPMTIAFDFVDATNLKSQNDMHMGHLQLRMDSNDELHESWTAYVNGKPDHTAEFAFTRKK